MSIARSFAPARTDSSPAVRPARKRITVTRRVTLGALGVAERCAFCADAYALYASYKQDVDRAAFERSFLGDDDARLALFYDAEGALVGFYCASLHRVSHGGREHLVFSAPLFIDTRYDGTREATFHAIVDALRIKVTEPSKPLAYLAVVTSPASYRLVAAGLPRVFPSRHTPTPPQVDALLREAARQRALTFVDDTRWLVKGLGSPRHPERLKQSQKLRTDPDAQFYMSQNPDFENGTAMLAWVPLDLSNLSGAVMRRFL